MPPCSTGQALSPELRRRTLTSDPLARQRASPATELPEAVEAQVREAREVLRADAEAAGVDLQLVDAAVDASAASFAEARVHAFIGILVEREVRATLRLATHDTTNDGQGGDTGTRR
jgi:hypothetical protein